MRRVWAWLRSDTGRAATVFVVPSILVFIALTTRDRDGYPSTAGWIVGGIAMALYYFGWEHYL